MKLLPKARTENLVEQNLGAETLIYDLLTHKAFNLNETLSVVYKACDGKQTFDELKRRSKFTDDFIYLALDELKSNSLLSGEYVSPFDGTSRREVIKKVGLATMFALPLIAGLVAPTAANAASGANGGGDGGGFALFGACNQNGFCYANASNNLVCVNNVCCIPSYSGSPRGSGLPGTSLPAPSVCADENLGSISCTDYPALGDQCCSGNVSGTCTEQGPDAYGYGPISLCYEDGATFFNATRYACNCTCG